MNFHIITLFPESLSAHFDHSIIKRAQESKKIKIKLYNPRDVFPKKLKKEGKRRQVDDRPYGGGPGMVMMAEPILKTISKIKFSQKSKVKVLIMSPSGKQFDTFYARKMVKMYTDIVIIAGHYEGIDARVKKALRAEDVTIGPYVLTGGELPAMVIVDCISRQIEGVLGKFESLEESRIATSEVYTRPTEITYKGKRYKVPKVLLSGDHKKIEDWKKKKGSNNSSSY